MPRKSKISPHAPLIHCLLSEGKTARAIWKELRDLEVIVSYEGLRKWIHANPIDGIRLNGPGRPMSVESSPFDFLPAVISSGNPGRTPAFVLSFVGIYSEPEDIRAEVAKGAFIQLGLPFDENLPRAEWIIPAHQVANIRDLEYCLLAYLVSDLPPPPLSGITQLFEEWFEILMAGAYRLKESVKQGRDIKGKDLFNMKNNQ